MKRVLAVALVFIFFFVFLAYKWRTTTRKKCNFIGCFIHPRAKHQT